MTWTNRHPRTFSFVFLLLALLILPLQTIDAAKRRHDNARGETARRGTQRAERGRKLSARERRAANRHDRLSARELRRGGKSRLSRRELRRESAREQSASLKALERRLRRPLSKRER